MPFNLTEHHTLADWDFQYGATNRSLSAEQFISSPTSLRIMKAGSGFWSDTVLCRIPATLVLPQGEVRTWVRSVDASKNVATFRNQAALGSANWANSYVLTVAYDKATLWRYIADVYTNVDETPCTDSVSQWGHYRVFWYNGKTPGEEDALCVDVYKEIDSEWIKQGSTLYDTTNAFKDSGINRAGFIPLSRYDNRQYWDDTEIWGPV